MTSELKPLRTSQLSMHTPERDQFEAFQGGSAATAEQVAAAVEQMERQYSGWLDSIAKAAAGNDRFTRDEVREGIKKMTAFGIWKFLVEREEQGDK